MKIAATTVQIVSSCTTKSKNAIMLHHCKIDLTIGSRDEPSVEAGPRQRLTSHWGFSELPPKVE
jgi:hypothetical protein